MKRIIPHRRSDPTYGFTAAPETFPKQPNVNEQRPYGELVAVARLAFIPVTIACASGTWANAGLLVTNAVAALLATQGDRPELIPLDARNYVPPAVQRSTTPASSTAGDANHATDDYWLGVLAGHEPGGRHDALLQLAGHLLGKGVNAVFVEELLVDWNADKEQSTKRRISYPKHRARLGGQA